MFQEVFLSEMRRIFSADDFIIQRDGTTSHMSRLMTTSLQQEEIRITQKHECQANSDEWTVGFGGRFSRQTRTLYC